MKLTRFKLIAVILGILVLTVIGTLLFLSNKPTKPQPNEIIITPEKNAVLTAESRPTINIHFSLPVEPSTIKIQLSESPVALNQAPKPTDINLSFLNGNRDAAITTKNPISPNSQFLLTVLDASSGSILAQTDYSTADILQTPAPSNNPQLKSYLPYNNPAYSIDYLESRNVYQFHFTYDPKSKVDIETQYQNAQSNAIQFIKSKGIDINSIVIEYKRF